MSGIRTTPRASLCDDGPYVVSDERLAEIRGLIDWQHAGWQTLPSSLNVSVYDLAAAVEDLLIERDERATSLALARAHSDLEAAVRWFRGDPSNSVDQDIGDALRELEAIRRKA